MKRAIILYFILTFSLTLSAQITSQPIKWEYKVDKSSIADEFIVKIIGKITDKAWHIYDLGPYQDGPNATQLTFLTNNNIKIIGVPKITSKITKKFDETFKINIGICEEKVVIEQRIKKLKSDSLSVIAIVEWQSCDEENCLPPTEKEINVHFPAHKVESFRKDSLAKSEKVLEKDTIVSKIDNSLTLTSDTNTVSIHSQSSNLINGNQESSIWYVILEAIIWGFVALLTPCVFPMVPMTVSFFLKSGQSKDGSKAKGRIMASLYGLSIVLLYTLPIAVIIGITYFAGGEAITADIFNWLATHWVPNVAFFLIFMIFAASFFGAFEITMPSWMVNKSESNSDKAGFAGVFFMALTLVLVSFSCTGPIVGSVLIKSTQGEIWQPIITMFAFSAAFALPFTLFAFAPSLLKDLPKSGGWLNSVKVVLGFLEVALGFKFLSVADQTYHWGLLDREVYLAIWIVTFALLGLYLLGKIRFAHDDKMEYLSVKRLGLAIATFAFVVYMIPGMWGAPLKALSGYLPPITTMDTFLNSSDNNTSVDNRKEGFDGIKPMYSDFLHLPHGLKGFFEYQEALEYAKKVGKPLFIDFTGHGCVNCREMEARVWSDPRVLTIFNEKYVLLALYADDKKEVEEKYWVTTESGRILKSIGKINSHLALTKFNVNAQPYYAIIDPNTEEHRVKPRGYDLDIEKFIQFLEDGAK